MVSIVAWVGCGASASADARLANAIIDSPTFPSSPDTAPLPDLQQWARDLSFPTGTHRGDVMARARIGGARGAAIVVSFDAATSTLHLLVPFANAAAAGDGTGDQADADEARDWVEYCNGDATSTKLGALRA